MKHKKSKKKMLFNFYTDKELLGFSKLSKASVLKWLEEANRFLYKSKIKNWKTEEELMKKIGW